MPRVIEALGPRRRQPLLERQRSRDERRTKRRILPPILLRQRREPRDQHEDQHHDHTARQSEGSAQKTIEKAETHRTQQFREQKGDQRPEHQYAEKNERVSEHLL